MRKVLQYSYLSVTSLSELAHRRFFIFAESHMVLLKEVLVTYTRWKILCGNATRFLHNVQESGMELL